MQQCGETPLAREQRRLAATVADVAGYSRRMVGQAGDGALVESSGAGGVLGPAATSANGAA